MYTEKGVRKRLNTNGIRISIAACRVNADKTQAEFAEDLNVDRTTIVNWESGKTRPSTATLHFLADLYKIPEENFLLPEYCT